MKKGEKGQWPPLGLKSQASNSQPSGHCWPWPAPLQPPLALPHMWVTLLIFTELKFNLIQKRITDIENFQTSKEED